MKIKNLSILVFLIPLFLSCNMEDLGNYDYKDAGDVLPVEIGDLVFTEPIQMQEELRYEPPFIRLENEERYTFRWYVIEDVSGRIPKLIELCQTKVLYLEHVSLDVGSYRLYLEVSDPELHVFVKKQTFISVTNTLVDNGWYILKDDGALTDMDYYVRQSYLESEPSLTKHPDVILRGMNMQIPGKAVSLVYFPRYYNNEKIINDSGRDTTIQTIGPAWIIQTDQTIVSINNTVSKIYKGNFADHFYDPPAVIKPQGIFLDPFRKTGIAGVWMINNNEIYSLYGMIVNVGKFDRRILSRPEAVEFFPEIIWSDDQAFVYEKNSGTFYVTPPYYSGAFNYPLDFSLYNTPNIDLLINKQIEPVRMLPIFPLGFSVEAQGVILFKHKTEPNKYYFAKVQSRGSNNPDYPPFSYIKELPAEADILNPAITIMASTPLINIVYYAKNNNELWVYTDNDEPIASRQKQLVSYPSGENITCIQHIVTNQFSTRPVSWVCVLTNTPSGEYNFYVYDTMGASADLMLPENTKLSGTGYARAFFPRFY